LLQLGGERRNSEVPIPRITDFGLARIIEEVGTGEETRSGVPFGSPPYMAPEQAAGRRHEVGAAADVYALGATLYEVMTGRPPFQGESYLETLRQVLADDPIPPRALRPGLPRDLETICLTCLEKDPARRYVSAAELRADLERFLRGEPIRARPISLRQRAAKWVRRRPLHAAVLLLVGLLTSGLLGGVAYRDLLLQRHAGELEREIVRADANARLARRHLQAFQLRQAQEAIDARQVERAQEILAAIPADGGRSSAGQGPSDLGFPCHYLMRLACRDLVVLSNRQVERVQVMALSPDGQTLATGDEDGTIRLRDPQTGRVRMTLSGHQLPVHLLAFAPDGARLISRGTREQPPPRRDEVLLWDLGSPRLPARVEGLASRIVEDLRWDVGGRHLWEISWIERDRLQLGLWDVATDPAHPRLEWRRPTGVAVLPMTSDGTVVALEEPGRRFVVHDLATGKDLGRTGPIDHAYDFAALSPDGWLLAVGRSHKISLWDVAAGREKARFDDPPGRLLSFGFSPDSRFLAFERTHGEIEIRDLVTGTMRPVTPRRVRDSPEPVLRVLPRWSIPRDERLPAWQPPAYSGLPARPVAPGRHLSWCAWECQYTVHASRPVADRPGEPRGHPLELRTSPGTGPARRAH
jgi:hypothetical protein